MSGSKIGLEPNSFAIAAGSFIQPIQGLQYGSAYKMKIGMIGTQGQRAADGDKSVIRAVKFQQNRGPAGMCLGVASIEFYRGVIARQSFRKTSQTLQRLA